MPSFPPATPFLLLRQPGGDRSAAQPPKCIASPRSSRCGIVCLRARENCRRLASFLVRFFAFSLNESGALQPRRGRPNTHTRRFNPWGRLCPLAGPLYFGSATVQQPTTNSVAGEWLFRGAVSRCFLPSGISKQSSRQPPAPVPEESKPSIPHMDGCHNAHPRRKPVWWAWARQKHKI